MVLWSGDLVREWVLSRRIIFLGAHDDAEVFASLGNGNSRQLPPCKGHRRRGITDPTARFPVHRYRKRPRLVRVQRQTTVSQRLLQLPAKRVVVTPAVYQRLFEFLHFDNQSTGQKSHCVNTRLLPSQCFVVIRQSDPLVRTSSKSAVRRLPKRKPPTRNDAA